MIRVALVDDHEIVRKGLASLVNAEPDMEVVGEAGSAAGALPMVQRSTPDVAILDISLGDGNGIDVCGQITEHHPEVACLMLTSVSDERALIEAEKAGAAGFSLKTVRNNDIVASIRKVSQGARLLDAVEIRMARKRLAEQGGATVDSLTPQERKIFDLIGLGHSNREIANEMFLAEKTVKNYVTNMFLKLGMSNRTEVAALASRLEERDRSWRD